MQIHIGGATLNQTPLAWESNQSNILEAIRQAQAQQVAILCLPELCLSGYGCEDAFHAKRVSEIALEKLLEIVPHTQNIAVAVGLPFLKDHLLYNGIAWVCNGELKGIVAKQFLAGQDLYYEPRWFKAWPRGVTHNMTVGDTSIPVGDLIFEVEGVRVGFEICEDAWVVDRPGLQLAQQGVDIILNASASHFAFQQYQKRKRLVEEGARTTQSTYIYSNLLGCEAGRILYDGSVLIASGDQGVLAEGPRFSYQDVVLTTAQVDIELHRLQRRKSPSFQPLSNDTPPPIVCDFPSDLFNTSSKKASLTSPTEPLSRFEEFHRAVALGLWDYLRKSRSRGFVVSVSGGADSSTVVVLISGMVQLALKELGWTGFAEKLNYLPWASSEEALSAEQIMPQLLRTLYQHSEHSSTTTYEAAKQLCESVHAQFLEFKIHEVLQSYLTWIEGVEGRELDWEQDDHALQNIQARVRAPSAWLLANIHGALLLSTSNRSEAAVGYATMDGDTCGGLSPIAGIDKSFIREWLCWMETEGDPLLDKMPVLSYVNAQAPTAELRPAHLAQTDESDLMPYPILDAIEKLAIRDRKFPLAVWENLIDHCEAAQHYSPQQLARFVSRFFRLWSQHQWKRERYAPSFHLDDENLDPKTWCRFPILSGGFGEELALLEKKTRD